ncbi:peptidoglycan-binding protein [Roseibium aquae]|uniref:Peptidoglycan-binding protein n=1 Tax=Roseibium aquae TaxID=1323746 RepID=A0A916TKD8_9HYPH|nr:peptidoglycan-binding protein [Roseibium aquae]GGB48675.1 peptidoglycan-binding protein [Roseibium aquae]
MPTWKNRDAGRRGRDHVEGADYYESDGFSAREPARSDGPRARAERLTRTATAIGRGRSVQGGHELEADHDLDEVADELDRLLNEREDRSRSTAAPAAPWIEAARNDGDRTRGERAHRTARGRHADPAPGADHRLETVLGALERLDRQVQDLAANQAVPGSGAGSDPARFDGRYGESRTEHARPGRRGTDERFFERDEIDPYLHDFGDAGQRPVRSDDDDDWDAPRMRPDRRRHPAGEDAPMKMYKELGRRIDALRKPQEEAFDQVREELGSLRSALGGFSKGTHEKVNRQNAELRRLGDMVERLRADRHNEQFAKEIRKEVAELKTLVGRTNVEGTLASLEHGYAHILQRLDELSRGAVDPRILKGVTARLNEIEDAFAVLPRSEHILLLEDRVGTISERMEELLRQRGHQEIEPLRAELREVRQFVEHIDISGLLEGIDDRMKFVSGRLDDLEALAREQRGLDTRLSAMEERMPAPETLARLQGRLEDIVGMMAEDKRASVDVEGLGDVGHKLDEIVGRLDRIESQPAAMAETDAQAFATLADRLDGINTKIELIEKRSNRPMPVLDASSLKGSSAADAKLFAQLQTRLNELSDRLQAPKDTVTTADLDKLRAEIGAMRASVPAPSSTEALEQRISDLADAVARGGDNLNESRLEQLASKVSALAEQLENNSGRESHLDIVTTALERIETGLQETRRDVVDIAKSAAAEVVAEQSSRQVPHSTEYDAAISGLQNDLKRLLDAAEGSEERTRNTFEGVKSVLSSVTERLESLERSNVSKPVSAASHPPQTEPGGGSGPQAELLRKLSRNPQAAVTPPTEPQQAGETGRDRKADFIAAARRAAQAASAEASRLEPNLLRGAARDDSEEERGRERAGWFRNVLRRGKKEDEGAETSDPVEPTLAGSGVMDREPVLAGDPSAGSQGKEAEAESGGGRRKALLYAAAAVLLAIGTLQVFNMVSGPASDEDAVAVSDQATPEPDIAAGLPADPAGNVAESAVTALDAGPAGTGAGEQQTAAASAPEPDRSAVSADGPGVLAGAASEAGAALPEPEIAFAPPSGVDNGFDAVSMPSDDFNLSGAGTVQSASLIASLPPEGVGPIALRSAAASGDERAAFLVGVKFTEGDGVPADLAEAAKWYQIAADKGLAPAQYRLASLYEKGRGVELDLDKARAWYEKAADAGNAKAMHNLAVLYAEGAGGAPDFEKAADWFERAAEYGVKDSLFNLGILYARGLGVEKDLIQSYKWFAIAAREGDQDAAKKRDDVANTMDETALNQARLAVETFTLKTPAPAANKVATEPDWASSGGAAGATPVNLDNVVDYEAMVRTAQTKLNALGFDTGTPDGQIGPRTRSAVQAFQRSVGLPETGEIDAALMEELASQPI